MFQLSQIKTVPSSRFLCSAEILVVLQPPPEFMTAPKMSVCRELGLPDTLNESEMTKEQKAMVDSMIDEYYSLDFEDIIGGDLPVRFKYAKVEGNAYGLSISDILEK